MRGEGMPMRKLILHHKLYTLFPQGKSVFTSVIVFFIRLEIIRHSHPIISIDFHVIFSTLFHRPKSEYTELDEVGGFN